MNTGFFSTHADFSLVEMTRVELVSEGHLSRLSTGIAYKLIFPRRAAHRQASHSGSLFVHDWVKGHPQFTFTANRRPYPGRGTPGKDGSLIRPRTPSHNCSYS